MNKKHAYLIMAHNEFHMLKKLIEELDDERNDIYIHIDKKTEYVDEDEISSWAEQSSVFFVPRIKIYRGTLSSVKAEISLLEEAVKREHSYYHLLSGVDFPLKDQNAIHELFADNNKEYISYHRDGENGDYFLDKVKFYYPLLKYIGRDTFEGTGKRNAFMRWLVKMHSNFTVIQRKFGIDRLKKYSNTVFYKGEQWFSITHEFACYVIAQKRKILKMFRLTDGSNELVMPTLAVNSEFAENVINNSEGIFLRNISFDRHPFQVKRLSAELHPIDIPVKDPLISIIVPCYNVEDYLKECVESLIAQTYPNIEILLIDDGSTDATSDIAKEYAGRFDKVLYHYRTNGGLSAARNTGIELAKGEYIAFVDSDDWVDKNYISRLFEKMLENSADISVCGLIKEYEDNISENEIVCFDSDKVISSHEAMKILGDIYPKENVLLVVATNKLFKRQIFDKNRFNAGKIHEDEFLAHRSIGAAETIAVITDGLYHYRIREGSITSDEKKQSLGHLDYLDAFENRLEYCRSMMYGDLFIYMLYTYYEGIKQLMATYSDVTISKNRLNRYFRQKAFHIYIKYFKKLDVYQKRDYLKLILFPAKYRNNVIRLRKEK